MNDPKQQSTRSKKGDSQALIEAGDEITLLYQNARNGTELAAKLQAQNYRLEKSTRLKLFVIDRKGGEHNLIFSIAAPREDVEKKLADIDPATLPLKKSRERDAFVKCFVSLEEKAKIEALAEREELSVSGYLRVLIFGKKTPQPKGSRRPSVHKQALVKLYTELNQVGNNLKKIEQHTQEQFFNSGSYKATYNTLLDAITAALSKPLTKQSGLNIERVLDLITKLILIGDSINQVEKQLNLGVCRTLNDY